MWIFIHTDFNGISFPVLSDAVLGLNVNDNLL